MLLKRKYIQGLGGMIRFVAGLIPTFALIPVMAAVACAVAESANAQQPERGETVADRVRPELDPLGIRMGGFLFYPQLGVAGFYNSNIFGEEKAREIEDYITVVSLGLQLRSNWNNHALNFFAASDAGFYTEHDAENFIDYTFGADGRADFYRVSSLMAALSFSKHHQDRVTPDEVFGVEPTVYTILVPEIEYSHQFGRFSFRMGGNLQRFDFDDVTATNPVPPPTSIVLNNDDRDRTEQEGLLRIGFEIVPGYEAFIQGTYNNRVYVDAVDDNGFNRNSSGYEAVVGTAIDLTGVTFGDIFVGYRSQEYEDVNFETIEGVQYGGTLTWNPSGLTTFKGSVVRTIEETTLANLSGYIATESAVSVDHELLRSLLLGADASYTTMEYQGTVTRNDNYVKAGVYSKYFMNRHVYFSARYDYTSRDSNIVNESYLRNEFMLSLQVQY